MPVKKRMSGKKRAGLKLCTQREKKFVKAIVETSEVGKSAVRAGYSDVTYGSKLLKSPRVLNAIAEAMEKAGIHDEFLAVKLKEGLGATYPQKFSSRGKMVQDVSPDFFTRSIYLDKALKIKGAYAPEKREITEKKIMIMITPEFVKGLVDSEAITDLEFEEIKQLPRIAGGEQNEKG